MHIFFPPKQGNFQEFLSSGTFTVPEGVRHVFVYGCGGGGGGTGTDFGDFGGDGAPLGLGLVEVTEGDEITVTIGAGGSVINTGGANGLGGDSSFGSLVFKGAGNRHHDTLGVLGVPRIAGSAVGGAGGDGEASFSYLGGSGSGGGAGPFGSGATGSSSAAANSGAGGGGSASGGNGGSGRLIVMW